MRQKKRILVLTAIIASFSTMWGQQLNTGYTRDVLSPIEYKFNHFGTSEHSNIQPSAFGLEANYFANQDVAFDSSKRASLFSVDAFGSIAGGYQLWKRKDGVGFGFAGVQADFSLKSKLSVVAGYSLNGMRPSEYISEMANIRINPGVGYAVSDKNNLYHTHYTYGHIAFHPGKFFGLEVGKGKHFWGDGYRSLLISDNAAPYPYARITTKFWNIKYTNLWAQMRDLSRGQILSKARIKYTASHALSWNIGKRINMSIYEMVVWQDRDTMSTRTLDMNYLNPIIFYRPVEYSVGSPDNVIMGLSMRAKVNNRVQVYGQFVLDEFNYTQIRLQKKWWANKYGGQLGIKAFDVIIPGLSVQSEMNVVRPFTYTHGSPVQAWTHLNQALAHPLGANFGEWVSFIRYDRNKWKFVEEFVWATYGRDTDVNDDGVMDNMGGNITHSYMAPYQIYGNELYQGLRSVLHYNSLTVSRRISTSDVLEVFFTHTLRYEKNADWKKIDNFFLIGIQTTGLLQPNRDY